MPGVERIFDNSHADRSIRWRRMADAPRLAAVGLGVVLSLLTLVPLAILLVGSLRPDGLPSTPGWTLDHYIDVWSSAYDWQLVANTLVFSAGSTALAVCLATALCWLLERTDLPARELFRAMILMPMATPPLLLAIGWALVLAPRIGIVAVAVQPLIGPIDRWFNIYSMSGAIFVQTLAYVPTSVLMLSPAIRALDPSLEEAALVAGAGPWQILWRVGLPVLRPALLSVMTILLIVGMLAFDIPAVIAIPGHVNLMSIEIFRLMTPPSGFPDYGAAAAMNAVLFVFLIGGLILYRRTLRQAARFATISGKGYKPAQARLGAWRGVTVGFVALYFLLAVLLPFIALLWASIIPYFAGFSLDMLRRASFAAYHDLFASSKLREACINAVLISATAAGSLVLLSLATAWIVVRSKLRQAWLLDVLCMVPLGVPPLMIGVALVFVAFTVRFLPLYGTIWVIALGHVIAFLPISSRMMQSGLLQISSELEEAAAMAGASLLRTFWRIILPLLAPTVIAAIIWILVHSVREFSIAVMLQSGRNSVLSTILYSYWDTGSPEHAAALAVLLMLLLLALVGILSLTRRRLEI
jgi:iron(III) transport system permease protein